MDEMTAFERQVRTVLARMGGPEPEFDAMTITRSAIASTASHRWSVLTRRVRSGPGTHSDQRSTMAAIARLVVAGVIVALFGGFLLTGVLTQPRGDGIVPSAVTGSPTPMTTQELLAGMVTEEVEPGIVRVLNDGYRDLSHAPDGFPWDCERVIVGDNDHVWRATPPCWRLVRLGEEGEWHENRGLVELGWGRSDASLDGRLWALEAASQLGSAPYRLRIFDDGAWVPDPRLSGHSNSGQMHVQGDGTVWLVGPVLYWADDASGGSISWDDAPVARGDGEWDLLGVTDDGVVWLINPAADNPPLLFVHFDGTDWGVVPGPDGFEGESGNWSFPAGVSAGVSANGTVWSAGDDLAPHVSLARLDAEGWTVFADADGVRPWGGQPAWWGVPVDTLWVAPDGSAWVNASVATIDPEEGPGCDGLARFDGEAWQSFLAGHCISDLDFAPDGSVWVVAQDRADGWSGLIDTYVISPEAVVASR